MRVRMRTLVIALMALSLLAAPIAPASALSVNATGVAAAFVFVGTATVPGLIGYPVCTTGGTPQVPCTSAAGQNWSFTADSTAAGQVASVITCGVLRTSDPGPPTTTEVKFFCTYGGGVGGVGGVGTATMNVGGFLTDGAVIPGAFCGASGGSGGSGSVTISGPNVGASAGTSGTSTEPTTATRTVGVSSLGWIQSAATAIVATGTTTTTAFDTTVSGPIVAVASAIPTIGQCADRTAIGFTVVGVALLVMTSPII